MNINNLLFLLVLTSSLLAEDSINMKFNYFGNLSASRLDSSGFDLNDYSHDSINDDFSLSPHSKAGAQLSLYSDDITLTAQGMLRKNHGKYEPELTWFNVKYDVNDNYAFRVGRIQTKVFLNSESLDIDYLHLWIKPPVEVYRLMPIRTYNGLELSYANNFRDYSFYISVVLFASYSDNINGSKNTQTTLDNDNSRSISLTLENDSITYKASFSRANTNINDDASTTAIVDGLASYGNDMDRFTYEDRLGYVAALGLQYRGSEFLVDAEVAHFESNSLFPSSTGAYLMLGYKMNKFIPFIMYAENKNDKSYYDTSSIKTTDATSVALKRNLDDLLYMNNFSQSTASLGLRYNIMTGMALKTQIDRISSTNYGSVTQSTVQSSGYEKVGILSRDAGTADKAIYAFSVSLSFAY